MASVFRYLVTVALAAFVTLSAFYLMHHLIDNDTAAPARPEQVMRIHFGPVDIPEEPRPKEFTPPPRPEPQEPPPETRVVAEHTPIDRTPIERPRTPGPNDVIVREGTFMPPGDQSGRDARPLATVPPPYPRRAALEGIEGWVRVSVTIDERGRVTDVRVLDAQPQGVFEDTAVRAVRGWTWKPAIVGGRTQAQTVIKELVFSLDEA